MRKNSIAGRKSVASALGLLCLLAPNLAALDPKVPINQYTHRVWRSEAGLPDNFIQAILQTEDGYLWLGTFEGLVRFDGYRFTSFDTRNTSALRHNSVVTLCQDKTGTLWIGTSGGGITLYKDGQFTKTLDTRNGLPNNYIRTIYEDRAGAVWITAHSGGLVKYAGGKFTTITTRDGLPSDSLRNLLEDSAGRLWVGTDEEGLCVYDKGRLRCFGEADGLWTSEVRVVYEDRNRRLWAGTRGGGLQYFDGNRFQPFRGSRELANISVRAITEDRQGNLWVGTDGGGAFRLNNGLVSSFSTKDGLPHSFVRSMFEDKEGNLWLGTRGGLSRLNDKQVETLTTAEGLPNDNIRTVLEDSHGSVWIGTMSGLSRIHRGRTERVQVSGTGRRDEIRALAQGSGGAVWIGASNGLFRWLGGEVSPVHGLLPERTAVTSILEDSRGRLWIGTFNGLLVRNGGLVRTIGRAQGLPHSQINALVEDRDGAVWAGTEQGLAKISDAGIRAFDYRDGISHDRINSLYVDAGNVLWAGTRGGLTRYKEGRFAAFYRRNGLLSDIVLQVVEDRQNQLWLSSRRGVSYIRKLQLDDLAAGRISALRPVSFDTANGMKTQECSGEAQPAGIRTRDGRIWFATVHGAVIFDPLAVGQVPAPPRVIVEKVLVDSQTMGNSGREVSVPPGSSVVEIQFTGISLSAPERVRFRYRLDGYDDDWVDSSRRRSAWYTQLPPGKYRFRVVAYSNDGSWPAGEASIQLSLAPRFHQTSWFYLLCTLVLAGIVILIYRLRVFGIHRRYQAVLEERARIGQEIHDTLMQGVTGISLQIEAASVKLPASPVEVKDRLDTALKRLDEVLVEARSCILELGTPALSQSLDESIRAITRELSAGRELDVRLTVEGSPRVLPEKVRTHLLRIAREAVTNSVLHSGASWLKVVLSFDSGEVRLRALDNGSGFDASRLDDSHFGIRSMKERTRKLGGTLTLQTAPGQGTEISVAVPTLEPR